MTYSSSTTPLDLKRLQQRALIVGVVFTALLLLGALLNRPQFFYSYLVAFAFWIGFPLGCLALLMLQHQTGGGWGFVIRRPLEAATRTLPLFLILFIPILLGLQTLYPWTHQEVIDELGDKTKFLNVPFFIGRSILYFAIWLTLAFFLNRWSREQDRTGDRNFLKKMRMLSGPGIVLFVITVTFASIDWVMSLDPHWSSTMFGFIFVAAWSVTGLAFAIAITALLAPYYPMNQIAGPRYFHDLGKLMLALIMLWAYFAFSQFLIIWSGNLPEEISYYLPRTRGAWGAIVFAVLLLHFALPFFSLLSRPLKRSGNKLVYIALLILVTRWVDFIWLITPNFTKGAFHISWMDLVAPIGIGGLWFAAYFWQLSRLPLVAINDQRYEGVLEQAHAHSGH